MQILDSKQDNIQLSLIAILFSKGSTDFYKF